ncbi:MAG: ATP-binding cassette domain-containing protein [Bryobacteraceae bacterium]
MNPRELGEFAWPASRAGDCLAALIRKARLTSGPVEVSNPSDLSTSSAQRWIERASKHLGLEADRMELAFRGLEHELAACYPALLRVGDSSFLAVLRANRRSLWILTPSLAVRRVSIRDICQIIREPAESGIRSQYERLLAEAQIPRSRRQQKLRLLLGEQLGDTRFDQCWVLHVAAGTGNIPWLRLANVVPNGIALVMAHTAQYLLWLASWVIIGRLSFQGRMDRGWLFAWALLLVTLIPFRVLTTWLQGLLAIGLGGLLKRRLLAGAMRLEPEEMREHGIGSFVGQALEAEAVETLALGGAVAGLLSIIELAVSAFLLGPLSIVLFVWCGITLFIALRFVIRYQRWTDSRMEMTHNLVESMIGHRTRLAQQPRHNWHDSEDRLLDHYFNRSHSLDRCGTLLVGAIPRGWLLAGVTCLAPTIAFGQSSGTNIAVSLAGILLAFAAFKRLSGSFADVAGAWVAWKHISPLFHAAARPEILGEVLPVERELDPSIQKVIEADRLTYRYRTEGNPALQACSLVIRKGDCILLEGPSGGGKTTFASLLCGTRRADSGLLLSNGLDLHTLGTDRWRERIAAAPQFHDNHILTETLAFNLLMGRRWPPTAPDMQAAESLCRQLGLSKLLDTMPSGILQMLGEGGWQLSHGERSRVYIARALLGRADLVILDESFAALDPENLRLSLECTLEHAPTLMVIAHP